MSGRGRFGPANYKGFVDSEGFDGGDGQVGVVGDGEHGASVGVDGRLLQHRISRRVGFAQLSLLCCFAMVQCFVVKVTPLLVCSRFCSVYASAFEQPKT